MSGRFKKKPPAGVPAEVRDFVRARFADKAGTLEIAPLSGDASTRRYFRVIQGQKCRVLALYPEPFDASALAFSVVRGVLAGFGLPVPEIVDQDAERGILLLEDLGDLTLQELLKEADPSDVVQLYREAVEQLVRLQQASARTPQPKADCFHVAFDLEKLSWELHYFSKHFLESLRGRELSVEDRSTLAEGFHRLAEEIASWPRVLCHRDFHSRNLMRHHGSLYWIDFQDARMGPSTYDLASLLRDSYVDLSEEFVADRAEEFRQRAAPGEAKDAFRRRFDLTSLQRNLKALGTFGYMATVRENPVYLQYIPRTLESARRNLHRHAEMGGLARVLAHHIEELR